MRRYALECDGVSTYHIVDADGTWVRYTDVTPTLEIVRKLLLHLNKDKDGSYFLTAESYKEIFDTINKK